MPGAQVSEQEKTGRIDAFYATDTGSIIEDGTGTPREFYQEGASVEFVQGDLVSYRLITTPSGRTITAGIRKPD